MAGKKIGGAPSKGSKQNHMVAPKAVEKDHPGGQHHPHHPNANHVASGHHALGKTIPSFHEAVNSKLEAEARASRSASKAEAGIAGAVKD